MGLMSLYSMMDRKDKEDYARLLALEINSYLKKIYRGMKRKVPLPQQTVSAQQLIMKNSSLSATKAWEFRLNSREAVARGDVGRIVAATRGLENSMIRKQRALLIAAEFYVYHAFANHPDYSYFDSIRCQNQYWDILKKLFRKDNSHEMRDHAVRYVIEEIKVHRLAHFRGHGWHTSIAKLDRHYPDIAAMLGSSEKTFQEIFRKQHGTFSPGMLRQEEDLVRKEIEDLLHLESLLKEIDNKKHPAHLKKLITLHLANLKTFRKILEDVRGSLDRWVVVDKEEHYGLRKRVGISSTELHRLALAESEAEQIDINKVHILFDHFKKEKINILRDIETLDTSSQRK
jgi:hypothetical protein